MFDPISAMAAVGGVIAATTGLRPRLARMAGPIQRTEHVAGPTRRDSVELSLAARSFAARTAFTTSQPRGVGRPVAQEQLTDRDRAEVTKLQQRDKEVRTHEQAHRAASGGHAGAISLQFTQGPDGKRYAVEGSVPIDLSPVAGDPAATIRKMQQVQRAALAPAGPSGADRRLAAQARRAEQQARSELTAQKRETTQGITSTTDHQPQTDNTGVDNTAKVDLTNPYAAAAGGIEQLSSARYLDLVA